MPISMSISEAVRKRGELETTALHLYEQHVKDYKSLIPRYESLLAKKQELRIKPLRAIDRLILNDFPKIVLLELDEEDALNYLTEVDSDELIAEINAICRYAESYVYVTLRSRIVDFQYEVKHHGQKSEFGLDPSYRHPTSRAARTGLRCPED